MFLWRRRSAADEIADLIQSAIDADQSGHYADAVDLYAKGIEPLLESLKGMADESAKQTARRKINEYMTRAELLKSYILAQKQQREQSVPIHAARNGSAATASAASTTSATSHFVKSHPQLAHTVLDEVLDRSPGVRWDDVAGLDIAKQILKEAVILPMLRPDLFTGLRSPPKGVLLFGPPGTGKTLLAKAVATESKATFFNISASTLTSKWVGEGEKLVRVLFAMARELQPAVIFIDEMDALLGSRSSSEHDASRRIKNQFFTELDGAASSSEERILVMGATNLPHELDEAIIRRLEKRIFVPLPDGPGRETLICHLLRDQKHALSTRDWKHIVDATERYSGSDLNALCKDAALGPIRELGMRVADVRKEDLRAINKADFQTALQRYGVSAAS